MCIAISVAELVSAYPVANNWVPLNVDIRRNVLYREGTLFGFFVDIVPRAKTA